jgi:hypothetical protein
MSNEVAEFHPFKFYKENPSLIRKRSGLVCDGCGCNFVRPRHYINDRVDSQKRMFCNSECWMKTVSKTVETNCHNCNATTSSIGAFFMSSTFFIVLYRSLEF